MLIELISPNPLLPLRIEMLIETMYAGGWWLADRFWNAPSPSCEREDATCLRARSHPRLQGGLYGTPRLPAAGSPQPTRTPEPMELRLRGGL